MGQQLLVERALHGEPVAVSYGIVLAFATATMAIPALAGVARFLSRDDVLAG